MSKVQDQRGPGDRHPAAGGAAISTYGSVWCTLVTEIYDKNDFRSPLIVSGSAHAN